MTTQVVNCATDEYDEYCGRPSIYSNPYRIGPGRNRSQALAAYRDFLEQHPEIVERARRELTGKRLGCHCKPKDCHLDILVEFMERSE